jgi:hypothetical protein
MIATLDFEAQIRERFPEGLTGCIVVGGTRTAYILTHQRHLENPGKIRDFAHYSRVMAQEYIRLATHFYGLGGQNLIMNVFGRTGFMLRGEEYAAQSTRQLHMLIQDPFLSFYHEQAVDPYFVGADVMRSLLPKSPVHQLGAALHEFQSTWDYQPGRRKLIWEVGVIQQYSFWRARDVLPDEMVHRLEDLLHHPPDLMTLDDALYDAFCLACYGTVIPSPHFYLGTNRKGTLKTRVVLPAAFARAQAMKQYYTPYPTSFMTERELQAVIEDVAFGGTQHHTQQYDYNDQYSPAEAEAEYHRFSHLRDDLRSIVGLSNQPQHSESETEEDE